MSLNPTARRVMHLAAIALVALLVAANLMLIFSFSAENREESGSRSREVTLAVARILYSHFDDLSVAEQEAIVDSLHGYIRKAAHFLEFALLGFLTAGLLLLLRRYRWTWLTLLQGWLVPTAFCLLYAVSDEVHQLFANRGARVSDVVIDFCGAMFGICCLHFTVWLISCIRRTILCRKAGKECESL